jgi:hypothetical protein
MTSVTLRAGLWGLLTLALSIIGLLVAFNVTQPFVRWNLREFGFLLLLVALGVGRFFRRRRSRPQL